VQYGVTGLRVVDGSTLPFQVSAHLMTVLYGLVNHIPNTCSTLTTLTGRTSFGSHQGRPRWGIYDLYLQLFFYFHYLLQREQGVQLDDLVRVVFRFFISFERSSDPPCRRYHQMSRCPRLALQRCRSRVSSFGISRRNAKAIVAFAIATARATKIG